MDLGVNFAHGRNLLYCGVTYLDCSITCVFLSLLYSNYSSATMTDLFSSGDSGLNSGLSDGKDVDSELQQFLLIERERAKIQAQIHEFSDICWDKCMDKPGSKLDSRTETCLSNCVDRFIDVSLLIANRFSQLVQKNSSNY